MAYWGGGGGGEEGAVASNNKNNNRYTEVFETMDKTSKSEHIFEQMNITGLCVLVAVPVPKARR